MQSIATNEGERKTPADNFSEMVLSALRCAVLRAKLDANEFTTIGIALNSRAITADDAIEWLADSGLISQAMDGPIADSR